MYLPVYPTSGYKNPIDWREFLGQIKSRGIILSFTLAFGMWLYVSLNGNYSTFLEVPVKLVTNENQAIESEIPKKILVEVKGRGWDLLNLKYIQKNFECRIDLSKFAQTSGDIEISHSKLLQSLTALELTEIKNINPDYFIVTLGNVDSKDVPIENNIIIIPRPGFVQVGLVELTPNSANIKGYSKVIKEIQNVPTEKLVLEDVFHKTKGRINVLDTFNQSIRIKPKNIAYSFNVQQDCNLELNQIPIEVRGGQYEITNRLSPLRINVFIQGGVEEIANINPGDVRVVLDYKEIINDSTGILVPKVILPPNVNLIKTEPRFIYHYIYKSGLLN